jgi:hypothetical protein
MKQFYSPVFDMSFLQGMLDKRKRALEESNRILPWSVYDGILAGFDARIQSTRGRGTYNDKVYGSMSFSYCVSCGKHGPLAADSFLALWYQCNSCTMKNGNPPGMRKVAETKI